MKYAEDKELERVQVAAQLASDLAWDLAQRMDQRRDDWQKEEMRRVEFQAMDLENIAQIFGSWREE